MPLHRAFVAALASVSLAACIDIGGLTGGELDVRAADAGDAGGPADDASGVDVRADTTEEEEQPSQDATEDAGGACAARRWALCDDFDHAPLGAFWGTTLAVGGTLAVDSDASVSPPNSLLVTLPLPSEAGSPQAGLAKTIDGPVSTIHCELALRLDLADPKGGMVPVSFFLRSADPGTRNYFLFLIVEGSTMKLIEYMDFADGGSSELGNLLAAPPLGQWQHYVIDVALGSAEMKVSDGAATLTTLTLHPPVATTATTLNIGISGVYAPGDDSSWSARFDDVRCALQ